MEYRIKKSNTGSFKLYQEGVRKYIALIMLFDGKPECVQAHWNVTDEFAVKKYKELTA